MRSLAPIVVRRTLSAVVLLLFTSILLFVATEILPGDAALARLGQEATEASIAAVRHEMGLDRPPVVRYLSWLANFAQGELGTSLLNGRPIADLIEGRLANTLILAGIAALATMPLAILLGLLSAAYADNAFDHAISIVTLMLISLPEFLVGSVLILVFSVHFGFFPAVSISAEFGGFATRLNALVLPAATLTVAMLAYVVRMTRASILDVLRSSYVEMALLKGASKRVLIVRHALPNALGPIANVVALNLGYLISGVVIVEAVFTYPGLGRLMVDSIAGRDTPMIQATVLIFAAAYIFLNLLADLATVLANPRLRS